MLIELYHNHLKKQLTTSQLFILEFLIDILQIKKDVRLERLARIFPSPITWEGRRRKLQRFLEIPQLIIAQILWPLIINWLTNNKKLEKLYITIDRTQWRDLNLLMISLVWKKRGIPLNWKFLPTLGNSTLAEQSEVLGPVFSLLKDYQIVVLGDREFCSVDLANWLRERKVGFSLRLKKNVCIEIEKDNWQRLDQLGVKPGVSAFYAGKRIRKSQPANGFEVAAKWRRKYRSKKSESPWFILTNLGSLTEAIQAYKHRMGIEEMFRDFKKGGYNLEQTGLRGKRLNGIVLVMSLAYFQGIIDGEKIEKKTIHKYVSRPKEIGKKYKRRSTFGVGLDSKEWAENVEKYQEKVQELINLSPHKRRFYRQGFRALTLIRSSF